MRIVRINMIRGRFNRKGEWKKRVKAKKEVGKRSKYREETLLKLSSIL